jgi:hypothetical protein
LNQDNIQILKKNVLELLKDEDVKIILFGSRARKEDVVCSDVDIGLIPKGELDKKKVTLLREMIENLNIPYRVDVVDFSNVSEEFKKEAMSEIEVWRD